MVVETLVVMVEVILAAETFSRIQKPDVVYLLVNLYSSLGGCFLDRYSS